MLEHKQRPAGRSAFITMSSRWLNEEEARHLIGGELGDVYRSVFKASCAPLGWFPKTNPTNLADMKNGTATLVRTPERMFAVTAAHVVREWQNDRTQGPQITILMDVILDQLDVIDISDQLDLVTFSLDESVIEQLSKSVAPLGTWPPQPPNEGCGILLGGYPGINREVRQLQHDTIGLDWGLFVGLVTADRVSLDQISWRVDRSHLVPNDEIPDLPKNADLGGISGGPVIALLERGGVHYWGLAGIVSQASAELENVIAKRADYICVDGTIANPVI